MITREKKEKNRRQKKKESKETPLPTEFMQVMIQGGAPIAAAIKTTSSAMPGKALVCCRHLRHCRSLLKTQLEPFFGPSSLLLSLASLSDDCPLVPWSSDLSWWLVRLFQIDLRNPSLLCVDAEEDDEP